MKLDYQLLPPPPVSFRFGAIVLGPFQPDVVNTWQVRREA